MMLGDLADKGDHRDADWDTNSLRDEFGDVPLSDQGTNGP
jgi:hypothetical protein